MTASKLMCVLVCGGRDYADKARVFSVLNFNRAKIAMIVHGAAKGADTFAGLWAAENDVPCLRVPAKWRLYGKKAGAVRNALMLTLGKPDLVVAFPGGVGTAMMVGMAKKAGVRVIDLRPAQPPTPPAKKPVDPEEALDRAVELERECLTHQRDWPGASETDRSLDLY